MLDPAVNGTVGILKAIKANAPSVKRVIVTSSFAAIVNPGRKWDGYAYSEVESPFLRYFIRAVTQVRAGGLESYHGRASPEQGVVPLSGFEDIRRAGGMGLRGIGKA